MLPTHNKPSCKSSVISPSISHGCTLSKLVHPTISGQNFQCTSFPSKSLTCSTVKNNLVINDVNVIRKKAANVVRDSVIARVSPRPSSLFEPSDFAPQCYSDSFKRQN